MTSSEPLRRPREPGEVNGRGPRGRATPPRHRGAGPDGNGSSPAFTWIDDTAALAAVIDELAGEQRYAIDTEFHRERTYFPRLALLQIGWRDRIALVDPLQVDLAPLAEVLAGPGVAIMHAGAQDLEVLDRSCGRAPSSLFDTQVAAGFLGYASPSLSRLVEGELGVRLPKGDRLTDWLARPLGQRQRDYAAADVAHLLELHDRLTADLVAGGRLVWAEAECDALLERSRQPQEPDTAWMRIKEARHLRGTARIVAQHLAAWRERTAAATDQPVRYVLSDLGLVGVAQAAPHDDDGLRRVRGVDGRHLRNGQSEEILAAVRAGRDEGPLASPDDTPNRQGLDRDLRPAVTLVSAWVSQFARDERFDPALLATRHDLEAFLRGDRSSRLGSGWRHDLLGAHVEDLVAGRAALAFQQGGGLVLEPRVVTGATTGRG